MTETTIIDDANGKPANPTGVRFDDRIDTNVRIGNLEVAHIMVRALRMLSAFPRLLTSKIALSAMAIIPGLYLQWLPKVVIDQVILQQPIDETVVPFPPHMMPLISIIEGMSPMATMGVVTVVLLALLAIFGGPGATWFQFSQGEDSATQSENQMNQGDSDTGGIVGLADAFIQIRLSQRLTNLLRTDLFRHMARLPMTTLDDHRIGDAVYRVMYDTPMLPGLCYQSTLQPLFAVIGAVISLYMLHFSYGAVAPELVWGATLMIPVALLITIPFSSLSRRVQQNSRAAGTATTNAIEESMSNIAAVQSLGGMSREKERIETNSNESFRRYRFVKIVQILIGMGTTLMLMGMALWAALFVTDRIIDGVMTPGDFGTLFGIALSLGGTAIGIGMIWIQLQGNAAALRRVFFFIDLRSEDRGETLPSAPAFSDAIDIVDVDFHYPDGRMALHNINIRLCLGELVAIVGPTGSGKTTLAYLVPGFVEPTRGRVLFDGTDLASFDIDSVRDQVSYVFQEHLLLSESIRDNLRLVRPDASEAEMREALLASGAAEFVDQLPDGIDTVLGRSGDTLSVGQKQRLCIARGLIRDTPILILDEPTAALDPATENALVRALLHASRDRLVIIIAHRLSTIRQADRIVFLEEGEIRDVGTHDDLMARPEGRYRQFVELQTG